MRLSIFPKSIPLPKNSEEKIHYAKFTSKPHVPKIVEISNEDDLIDKVCNYAWSPFIFDGYRLQNNFLSTDFAVFDIDEGMKIGDAEKIVESLNLACLCLPSTSHTEEQHKFRLIFPLSRTIRRKKDYILTMDSLGKYFSYDPACFEDTARFYYGSKMIDGFWFKGDFFESIIDEPEETKTKDSLYKLDCSEKVEVGEDIEEIIQFIYGETKEKIPEQIDFFVRNASTGLSGKWWNSSRSFIFTLALVGISFDKIKNVYESLAPDPLDDKDIRLLENAFSAGYTKFEMSKK